ncbi:glycosyltransferase family 1 protein [Mediterranea sp. An20]|uniref:glycosyltransferase family 1 protein n=1 Tax=Mediterranea sp. An20 TaxID=1965586 RepID=UPI0011238AC6|nr:glycosyltransferase family 1 protein [Mediterranea sp. An20]
MSKRILYLMHIPWGWIKQRPHFIAEGLNDRYDVTIICPRSFKAYPSNNTHAKVVELFRLPFERFSFVRIINRNLYNLQVKKYIKRNDCIWFTSPLMLPQRMYKYLEGKRVIYDCMDDMLEFPDSNKEIVIQLERSLYKKADAVFCSSDYLLSVLKTRYFDRNNLFVVNNAVRDSLPCSVVKNTGLIPIGKGVKMVYIGTISEWFDFELIIFLQKNIPNLELYLFGPKDIEIPSDTKIHYCGIIQHDIVFSVMDEADILIMPFKVTQLILSVNPVKLYEYILSGRPCLAPLYTESLKFGEYVYLYKDMEDCLNIVKNIISSGFSPLKTKEASQLFVKSNTWGERLKQIDAVLNIIL